MKYNRKYIHIPFILVLLFFCTWTPQQTFSEQTKIQINDVLVKKAKASTVRRKYIHIPFILVLLFFCTWTPQQTFSEQTKIQINDVLVKKAKASTVRIIAGITAGDLRSIWSGTGFFVSPDKIVTNLHVIIEPGSIFAKQDDNDTIWVIEGVSAYDMKHDLAILKVTREGIPLPLGDSDTIKTDDPVYASMYPSGKQYTITAGIIHKSEKEFLVTSAESFKGSSGCPMLNDAAEVIGVNFGVRGNHTLAIPSNILKTLLSQEKETVPLVQWYKQDDIRAYVIFQRAHDKYETNDYEGSIKDFTELIEFNPNFLSAYYLRGDLYSYQAEIEAQQGRMEKAHKHFQDSIADYTAAIELDPKEDTAYRFRGLVHTHYGEAEAEIHNYNAAQILYKTAIIDYNQAITLDPEDDENYAGRGRTKYLFAQSHVEEKNLNTAQKLYEEAIDDINEAIRRDPRDVKNYKKRGWAKYLLGKLHTSQGNDADAKKNYQAAIIDADKAIELNAEVAYIYHTRGAAKAALSDYHGAIEDFDAALNIKPDDQDFYTDRAKAKEALGKLDEAKADFTKAKQAIGQGVTSTKEINKAAKEMVRIPAGEFQMGSNKVNDASPEHKVYLDEFLIDAYEVTNAQFKMFIDANPDWSKNNIPRKYHNGRYLRFWDGDNYPKGKENHPVVYVSWYAAMAYANWVGKRLPTEAEWEKAARGGKIGQRYVWGKHRDPSKANYGYFDTNTLPVGTYLPNDYGLYDMGGNVWELCLDQYDRKFYSQSPKKNPIAGDPSMQELMENYLTIRAPRVSRGGSWNTPGPAKTADRESNRPHNTNGWQGFRCAKSIPTE